MKIQYILHAHFERPGIIETWAKRHQFSKNYCCPFSGEPLPSSVDYDLLVVMGGPQSPLSIEKTPYLKDEIETIKQAINQKVPVLGFCLGAQLIGEALGAQTESSPNKEVGFFPIYLTEIGKQDVLCKNFPDPFPVMHWHNDMPGLTKEAEILAYSKGCPRQIIRYLPFVYGFQCHPELLRANIEAMIENCPEDLTPQGKYIQSQTELLTYNFDKMNQILMTVLDSFVSVSKK